MQITLESWNESSFERNEQACWESLLSTCSSTIEDEGTDTIIIYHDFSEEWQGQFVEKVARLCGVEEFELDDSELKIQLDSSTHSIIQIKFFLFTVRLLATAERYCRRTNEYNEAGIRFHEALYFSFLVHGEAINRHRHFMLGPHNGEFVSRNALRTAMSNSRNSDLYNFMKSTYGLHLDFQFDSAILRTIRSEIQRLAPKGKGAKLRRITQR